jgi:hypothetical protein
MYRLLCSGTLMVEDEWKVPLRREEEGVADVEMDSHSSPDGEVFLSLVALEFVSEFCVFGLMGVRSSPVSVFCAGDVLFEASVALELGSTWFSVASDALEGPSSSSDKVMVVRGTI